MLSWFIDLILHLDRHLVDLVAQYHFWVYGILFAIIFAETGFVVTPFLPGDSLLFDSTALHGPETLVRQPMTYLSIIVYPRQN